MNEKVLAALAEFAQDAHQQIKELVCVHYITPPATMERLTHSLYDLQAAIAEAKRLPRILP